MLKDCGFISVNVLSGPKLPDLLYQKEGEVWERLITGTERGLEDMFS
jgi:hypothetical protein